MLGTHGGAARLIPPLCVFLFVTFCWPKNLRSASAASWLFQVVLSGRTLFGFGAFAFDQDAGGAIRAPGRCDVYMGIGEAAGEQAGHTFAEGRLYYLLLKDRDPLSQGRTPGKKRG